MVESIIKQVFNAIIPAVHAAGVEWSPGDKDVWSRLKRATTRDEYGRLSREVANVISITQNSSMFGVFAGITIFSKNTFMDFIENNRATHFKSHIDAKDELTNRMNRTMFLGGVSWTWRCLAVGFVYSTLISFIPVIRNRNEWQEYVIGGGVGGTLAGYLFSDQKSLGFIEKKPSKRISYRQLSMLKGFSYGLLFGAGIGAWCCLVKKGNMESQLRQWEDYWKDRKTKDSSDTK